MNTKKATGKGTRAFEFHRKQLINLQEREKDNNVIDTKQNYELRQKLTNITLRHRCCEQKKFIEELNKKFSTCMSKSKENRKILIKIIENQRVK
jgi:hypothetical protein